MSKYTTEVRQICETYVNSEVPDSYRLVGRERIRAALPYIFDVNEAYPIFDEGHREELNLKIIEHYYMREIGFETVPLWVFKLNSRMREIMPYYNDLYSAASKIIDPFNDVDYVEDRNFTDYKGNTTTHSGTDGMQNNSTRTPNLTQTSDVTMTAGTGSVHRDAYSNTPQGTIAGVEGDIGNNGDTEYYLTNYRKITDSKNGQDRSEGTETTTGTETVNESSTYNYGGVTDVVHSGGDDTKVTVKGKRGGKSYAEMYKEYQKSIVNIDLRIIEELADLFMLVY